MNKETLSAIWSKISPCWPLKNLIAVNPLLGFDTLQFEDALNEGASYFQRKNLPNGMKNVNRESIKWLQLYLDQGQSSIRMPLRDLGFLNAILRLLPFDRRICSKKAAINLPSPSSTPEEVINKSLLLLRIPKEKREVFLTLMLTTLPGWASYIQYLNEWFNPEFKPIEAVITQTEYLAFRVLITALMWPAAEELLIWHDYHNARQSIEPFLKKLEATENSYQNNLFLKLNKVETSSAAPKAQLIFCIDVRSEPFRRALEQVGDYETFGFAGFFGIPLSIQNQSTHYASCPVLLKPKHVIQEYAIGYSRESNNSHEKIGFIKKLYQGLKYNFTTPFVLVEILGSLAGSWILLRTLAPKLAYKLKEGSIKLVDFSTTTLLIDSIPFENRCKYALNALQMIGLVRNFAPLVVLSGHGSQSQNNTHATALDCGACGGRAGAPNARILASILNDKKVRNRLAQEGISIPDETCFLGAQHNTTTDELELYTEEAAINFSEKIEALKKDLRLARLQNTQWRCQKFGKKYSPKKSLEHSLLRSRDWAQVRPEWGLAKNAAMVVGPRWLTQGADLDGRSFLHSYDYKIDSTGKLLETILTAPMIVGYWINTQYFFSTFDNVAYGAGSKITKNITGKMGVMQGNASDLMNGLPLQSVYSSDTKSYHEPLRLLTTVYAPRKMINNAIHKNEILQRLFFNGWVKLACIDPEDKMTYLLQRNNTWKVVTSSSPSSSEVAHEG